MINIRRHRREIERFYTDRMTLYRYEPVKDPVTKSTMQIPQIILADQPCRISQTGLGKNGQTEAQNDIQYETKLFVAPEVEIRQGDLLEVTREAVTRRYEAGEPFPYSTHQEVSLQRKEWA
ncbi:ABC transporter ATP-binding protein [Cohnella algarum]|uniref:ABC transporter ATP-binding protein n=1 Tax=Cohnella algarum TaxID=2044859 RepID=UPI00196753DA|nr:ABC transporter ATP-binding protein [Cohnella algarum]MBN2980120.1 ABC transporter ATP-binding protein [Cohnella algarum]